ncbi:MAG: hypothetical protein JW787_14895 [Sedimentisphaerales bacterium]|nr:hypothetical protein [Sedimentisphaerales bacterium]
MAENEIENKVDEMLKCLDIDIEHIQTNLSRLNELRSMVIKRDDAQLQKLLNDIHAESDKYKEHESKRHMIRKGLADSLGCGMEKITLSMLETRLPEPKRNSVSTKKTQLKSLVENFKKEYAGTIILVSECSRFNKLLIKSIFNLGKTGSAVYNARGTVGEHKEVNKSLLVNFDF